MQALAMRIAELSPKFAEIVAAGSGKSFWGEDGNLEAVELLERMTVHPFRGSSDGRCSAKICRWDAIPFSTDDR